MDPDETLRQLRDTSLDPDVRLVAALALHGWLAHGGYRPGKVTDDEIAALTDALRQTTVQHAALAKLCERYGVPFDAAHYHPAIDCEPGWLEGWLGGTESLTLFVGVSPNGEIHS